MIKKLQKKLTTLLIFLLTIIWIGILLLFLNSTYKNNLKDVKEDVRSALREIKWKNFIRTQGTALDLEDIGYCVFQIDDYKQPHILFFYSKLSPTKQMRNCCDMQKNIH